jgi:hypothetical protein
VAALFAIVSAPRDVASPSRATFAVVAASPAGSARLAVVQALKCGTVPIWLAATMGAAPTKAAISGRDRRPGAQIRQCGQIRHGRRQFFETFDELLFQ